MGPKTLILIPARYESRRFPGKPLALIAGMSLLQRVYNSTLDIGEGVDSWAVAGHPEIEHHVKLFGGNVVCLDSPVPTGSDRVALAFERYFQGQGYERIVNLQGDLPLASPSLLREVISFSLSSGFDITTALRKVPVDEGYEDPHVVKCAYSEVSRECLYFSRSPIPHGGGQYFRHLGLYVFTPEALRAFTRWGVHPLERQEGLEQLRALGHSLRVGAILTQEECLSVDVPEDVQKVEAALK